MDPRPGGAWSAVMIHGPERIEIPFSGEFREVIEPEVVELSLSNPDDPESGLVEVLRAEFRDLGDGRTEMTFTQRGGNLAVGRVLARDARFADLLRPAGDTPRRRAQGSSRHDAEGEARYPLT